MEVSTSSPLFFCYYVYNKSLYFYSSILYSPYTKYFLRIYLFNFFSLSPPFSFFLVSIGGSSSSSSDSSLLYMLVSFFFVLLLLFLFSTHKHTHTLSLISPPDNSSLYCFIDPFLSFDVDDGYQVTSIKAIFNTLFDKLNIALHPPLFFLSLSLGPYHLFLSPSFLLSLAVEL